jgi:hypothetical protein
MNEAPTSASIHVRIRSAIGSLALAAVLVGGPAAGATLAADPTPTPTPTATATPDPTPTPSPTPPPIRTLSLLRSGDFVRQYTSYQCVGASLQTMRNMIWTSNVTSRLVQRTLFLRARRYSLYRADGGADPFGWTMGATVSGHGRYVLVAAGSMQAALKIAARGMALTHRPAGLVVWRGAHAWVLTGVDTTADPATTTDFQVTAGRIADPLYPYYHVWHRTIYRPGTRLALSVLASNYSAYHDPRRDPRIEGKWVAIVPLRPDDPLPAGAMAGPFITPPPTPTPAPTAGATPTPSPVTSAPQGEASPAPAATPAPTPEPTAAPTPEPATTPTPDPSTSPGPDPSA